MLLHMPLLLLVASKSCVYACGTWLCQQCTLTPMPILTFVFSLVSPTSSGGSYDMADKVFAVYMYNLHKKCMFPVVNIYLPKEIPCEVISFHYTVTCSVQLHTHLLLIVCSWLSPLVVCYPFLQQCSCRCHCRHHVCTHSPPRCCPAGSWLPTQDQLLLHHNSLQDMSTDSSAQWWMELLQLCTPKSGWCLAPP